MIRTVDDQTEALAACDRCGRLRGYSTIKIEAHTGLWVCPGCMDPPPVECTTLTDDIDIPNYNPGGGEALEEEVTAEQITESQFKDK